MILLWLLLGSLLPALLGWLLLRLLEGRSPVLLRIERIALGFLLGLTLTMFVTFSANVAGLLTFTRMGFLAVQIALVALLFVARFIQWKQLPAQSAISNQQSAMHPPSLPVPRAPLWIKASLAAAIFWTFLKILSGALILISTPAYFDDTLKNWNYRAKVFVQTGVMDAVPDSAGVVSPLASYPPTVSLSKTWLTVLSARWNEGLVNLPHVLWFLCAITLLIAALRRRVPGTWALAGGLLFANLPLTLLHGVNAYADVFVSAHLFAAVSALTFGLTEQDAARRSSFLRLGALATALLVFTKNETLLLYLPLLLALLIVGLGFLRRAGRVSRREIKTACAWYAGWITVIALPWLIYKWSHGLTFGNAKAISGTVIGWQPGVLRALGINLFFEGNWHLLFPVLLLLIVARGRSALRSTLAPLLLFVLAAITLQLLLFLMTSLSVEALMQTGIGRGIVQLSPVMVLLIVLWVRNVFREGRF